MWSYHFHIIFMVYVIDILHNYIMDNLCVPYGRWCYIKKSFIWWTCLSAVRYCLCNRLKMKQTWNCVWAVGSVQHFIHNKFVTNKFHKNMAQNPTLNETRLALEITGHLIKWKLQIFPLLLCWLLGLHPFLICVKTGCSISIENHVDFMTLLAESKLRQNRCVLL